MTADLDFLAKRFHQADSLLIITGAGMGVDSGFATFRGEDGLWPSLEARLGVSYLDWATPAVWFDDPQLAWGFYGTRMVNYRNTPPHEGYHILRKWRDEWFEEDATAFFTTNVDDHALQVFPYHEVVEKHGSLFYGQHIDQHSGRIYDLHDHVFDIDPDTILCSEETLPRDEDGKLLRAAVLLFDDFFWNGARFYAQAQRYLQWQYREEAKDVFILEIGCGDEVITGRYEAHQMMGHFPHGTHVRINPCEPSTTKTVPPIHHLQYGALDGLRMLDEAIRRHA